MRKPILLLIISLFLVSFIFGCSSEAKEPMINYSYYLKVVEERNNLVYEYSLLSENNTNLNIELETIKKEVDYLKGQLNLYKQENIMNDNEWIEYLWDLDSYDIAPTKCKNPSHRFSMCKEGCTIKYYCDTTSMNPLFDCKAKLTLSECSEYNEGDIILFKNKDKSLNKGYDYLIHSIVRKEGKVFITKGYNNQGVDNFTTYKDDIKGKVIKIEYQ